MQILPVDLTSLVGTNLDISIVLVPVIGLTARFALKPAVQAMVQLFDHQNLGGTVRVLERRIDFREHRIEALESSLRRLSEGSEFDRQLRSTPARAPAAMAEPSSFAPSNGPTSAPTDGA